MNFKMYAKIDDTWKPSVSSKDGFSAICSLYHSKKELLRDSTCLRNTFFLSDCRSATTFLRPDSTSGAAFVNSEDVSCVKEVIGDACFAMDSVLGKSYIISLVEVKVLGHLAVCSNPLHG